MKHTTAHPICEDTATRQLKSIPEHWHIRRLKFVANIVAGQSPPSEIITDYDGSSPFLQGNAEFGTTTPTPRFSCQTPNKRAQRGDILLSVRAPVGAINTADQDYGIGRGLCAISPTRHINENFLHYTLQVTKISLSNVATGSTYDAVTVGQVGDIPTPLPSPSEQAAIVRYLDYANELINRYISAKERLIALLEEQRQAVINQAVTRGLDPKVKLKPSSAHWLGNVPERWEMRRAKQLFNPRRELARPDDVQLSATQAYGVIPQDEYEQRVGRKVVKISLHLDKRHHVEVDDFVISMRSFQGGLERAWATGCIRSSYVVLHPTSEVNVDFFSYLFKSQAYIQALQSTANFIRDGQDLNFNNFCAVDLPVPPAAEQRETATALGQATSNIDANIARTRHQIDLIIEYRIRLIADVVTGQIDVRNATVELPAEAR